MADEGEVPADALESALADIVEVFTATGTAYALIGGLATGYRSRPRYTRDIDVLVDVPQVRLPAVLDRLHDRHFTFDARALIAEFREHHLAVLWRGDVRLDWLAPVLPAYRHVLESSREEPGPGGPVRVATAEGLILMKLFAYRLQDQADIEALVVANRDSLDLAWIKREWNAVFPSDDPRMQWLESLCAA